MNLRSLIAVLIFFLVGLSVLLGQADTPTPSPSPSPSPTVSPTPAAIRVPTPTPAPGAQNFHRWGSITVFNGLPSDTVHAIAQTADGLMWFGTDNGLARYDGRRVERISLGGEASNRVLCLAVESVSGRLYIGTENGAFVYEAGQANPITTTEGSAVPSISSSTTVYLGTASGQLLSVHDGPNGSVRADPVSPESLTDARGVPVKVNAILPAEESVLVGTSGLGVLKFEDGKFSAVGPAGRPMFVNGLAADNNGGIWIAAEAKKGQSGLFLLEGERLARIAAGTGVTTAVAVQDGDVWAGTDRAGAFRVSKIKTENFTLSRSSGGLRSDTVHATFYDREGVVWLGTDRGVSRFDSSAPFVETFSDLPNRNFVRSLWQSGDGRVRYAGTNRGLVKWDGTRWNVVPALAERAIYDIGQSNAGVLGCAPNGIFDGSRQLLDGECRALEYFHRHPYAAVKGRGVVDIETGSVVLADPAVSALRTSSQGLVIGAENAVYIYDGKTATQILGPERIASGAVWKIFESDDLTLWLAAEHGIFSIRNGEVAQAIATEAVRDVFVRGDDIWAATTTRGIVHARRDAEFGLLTASIGSEQGMPSDKAFAILPLPDEMLVATNRGLVHLPRRALPPKIAAVRILSHRLHDARDLGPTIELEYPENSLLVEVAGLSSRTFPEEFQYTYTLRNDRGDTIEQRVTHDAQYAPAGLASGNYTIQARSVNRDLLVSDPLTVRFSVARAPFPWTAAALAVLLILAVAGLIFAFVEHRRMRHRNRELAAARFDLANEAERERRRIARDLHDQTLGDLRELLMRTDNMQAAGLRSEIENISREIRRICEDLSPSVLENIGLVAALNYLLTSTFPQSTFSAPSAEDEPIDLPMNTQLQIYRIVQEVLTNIRLHSDAKNVAMTVDASDAFEIVTDDDGSAFSPDTTTPHGRGIANIRARAAMIGARASWSAQNTGNRFVLTIDGPKQEQA